MRTWDEFMDHRAAGKEKSVPWFLHDKLRCYRFLENRGLPAPRVLAIFNDPSEIDLDQFEPPFVLKPTLQSSMKGVLVLADKEGDRYRDALRGNLLSIDEIIEEQKRRYDETTAAGKKIIVEALVKDADGQGIPYDYKAYAFRGEIFLMVKIDRNSKPTRTSWFDGDFNQVRDGRVAYDARFTNESDVAPQAGKALLDLARKTSVAVPSPFARIDMFHSTDGPLVGEITLVPGGLYRGKIDRLSKTSQILMASMWHSALKNIEGEKDGIARSAYGCPLWACDEEMRSAVEREFVGAHNCVI